MSDTRHFIPAFPGCTPKGQYHDGMSYFSVISTQALAAIIIANPNISEAEAATKAVAYADALLKEMAKREPKQKIA